MGMLDIKSIFPEIANPADEIMRNQMHQTSMASNGLAGLAGSAMERLNRNLGPRAAQMTGNRGFLSPMQNLTQEMQSINPNDPNAGLMLLEAAKKYAPERVPAVYAAIELQRKEQEQERLAEEARQLAIRKTNSDIGNIDADTQLRQAQAQREQSMTLPPEMEQLRAQAEMARSAAQNQKDIAEAKKIEDGLAKAELGLIPWLDLDPSDYDIASKRRADRAIEEAGGDLEAVRNAQSLLLPKAEEGYIWRKKGDEVDEFGNPAYEQYPGPGIRAEVTREVIALNQGLSDQKRTATRMVNNLDRMLEAVNAGAVQTGIKGIALQQIPGTGNYAFGGDLANITNNLGFEALMEAKAASSTGASGFGQLSDKEMQLLTSLVTDLSNGVGLDKETLMFRLEEAREAFDYVMQRSRTDWTVDQYIGFEEVPPIPEYTPRSRDAVVPNGSSFVRDPNTGNLVPARGR